MVEDNATIQTLTILQTFTRGAMIERLRKEGYTIVDDGEPAEVFAEALANELRGQGLPIASLFEYTPGLWDNGNPVYPKGPT